jgi:hypothetical protein
MPVISNGYGQTEAAHGLHDSGLTSNEVAAGRCVAGVDIQNTKGETPMKKILLGLVAVFALTTFAAPARAEEAAAGGDKPADGAKKEKKGKKGKKGKEGEAPAGDDAAKK